MNRERLFSEISTSLWIEDYYEVKQFLNDLKREGVEDIERYLEEHPQTVEHCARLVNIIDVNSATVDLFRAKNRDELFGNLEQIFTPESLKAFQKQLIAIYRGDKSVSVESQNRRLDGKVIDVNISFKIPKEDEAYRNIVLTLFDITTEKETLCKLEKSTKEWTYAMEFIEDAIYLIDLDDKVVRANKTFYQMTGLTPEQVIGQDITSVIHPEGEAVPCPVCQARLARKDALITMEADHPDNPAPFAIEVMVKMVRDETSEPIGVLMGIHNLAHIREQEEQLRLTAKVFENTNEAILITDPKGKVLKYNTKLERLIESNRKDMMGTDIRECDSIFSKELMENSIWDLHNNQNFYEGEVHARRKNGERYMLWISINKVLNPQGEVSNFLVILEDITEKRSSQERIYYLANYDELTGLPNRNLFNEKLDQAIKKQKRYKGKFALLFIDLDNFKIINDTLGHDVGDFYLRKVSTILTKNLRDDDLIARVGGDEFVILIPQFEYENEIEHVASKILETLKNASVTLDEREIISSCSIGITLCPDDGEDISTLYKNADTAMYNVKDTGGNNYRFFAPAMNEKMDNRLKMEEMIRKALKEGEFSLHYQPQYDIHGTVILGMEALIRWKHPQKGYIPPLEFIPIAEQSHLILKISAWVLNEACRQIAEWKKMNLKLVPVAINFSAHQLHQKEIVGSIDAVMQTHGVFPREIECEITESTLMENLEMSIDVANELHQRGIKIAIDDFGTGYSSLNYLKRFPVDKLKVDKSFIDDIEIDPDDEAIAKAVISLGHSLGLKVVAEGVETASQLNFLAQEGCDLIQGYLFSKPLPPEEVTTVLKRIV